MARERNSMVCVVVDAFVDLVLLLLLLIYEPIEIPRDGVLCFVLACSWLLSSSSSSPSSSSSDLTTSRIPNTTLTIAK